MIDPIISNHVISISEAQNKITRLPEQFAEDSQAVIITRHGKPVMAVLSIEAYKNLLQAVEALEGLQETIEIMQDEELMASIRQGIKEMAEGKGRPWEEVKKELGAA